MVGRTIASKLIDLGHEVMMGTRRADNEKAISWVASAGGSAKQGSFADAARFGEIVVNATNGAHALDALRAAGNENLKDKILIDVANPLDPETGALTVCNTDSLGEQIQRAFPQTRVVKTLNTMNHEVMVQPDLVPGPHNVFISGNNAGAKVQVGDLLQSFGWPAEWILDLGDVSTARGAEMYLILWLSLWRATGAAHFNIRVCTG